MSPARVAAARELVDDFRAARELAERLGITVEQASRVLAAGAS